MIKALYTSATGMNAQALMVDNTARATRGPVA